MNIDEIYLGIATHCMNQINGEWQSIHADVHFFNTAAEFDIVCTGSNGDKQDLDAGFKLFKLFKSLHDIMNENGSNKWNCANFRLNPAGDFSIDFSWDQALADEVERLGSE